MADPSLPVHLSARGFHFRADSEAYFLRGCRSGLRMLLGDDDQVQGLQVAGLPARKSQRAETRGDDVPFDGAIHTPQWHEDKPEEQPNARDALQHLGDAMDDDHLVVHLPEEERSIGCHLPEPNPPEAPYMERLQRG